MSDESWITHETPVYVLCNPPEKGSPTKGLLWGQGNAVFAELHAYDYWAVVRVQSYRKIESEGRQCVEFEHGEIVFEGGRAEAIKALIGLGAEPARISVEVQVRDAPIKFSRDAPYVRTGDCGTSIVAEYGIARTGRGGYAATMTEDAFQIDQLGGIAWAGARGYAKAGAGGLAIVNGVSGGMAIAGDGGIALGWGGHKTLFAGKAGKAVTDLDGKVWVGDNGIGICRLSGSAYGGSESIVIGDLVSGGMGSLLVARRQGPKSGEWQVAYGFVGRDGIRPGVKYTVENNRLAERTNEQLEKERGSDQ